MKIVNNNKKYKCRICRREITTRRRVFYGNRNYHLSCFYDFALRKFKEWRKIKNHLSKYKRDIVMEKLR